MKKLLQKWHRWRAGRRLAKVINDYNAGYNDGYTAGWDAAKKSEVYPL